MFLMTNVSQAMATSLSTTAHSTDSGMFFDEYQGVASLSVPTVPFAGAYSLTTPLTGGNNHRGIFFDLVASNEITVCNIDINALGNTDYEIHYRNGTHVGFESNSSAWTLIGSATNVLVIGIDVPTPLPIPVNTPITVGSHHGFYVTSSNVSVSLAYSNGTTVGNTIVSDANLSILEGAGGEYPFLAGGSAFSPRNFNGTIHYDVGSGPTARLTYDVGGNVSGLNGSVTLQNNGGNDMTLNADGGFSYSGMSDGAGYDITVSSQPATQTCQVSNGTGTIAGANVTNVDVVCVTNTHTVGGNVAGLNGPITLQNNGGDDIILNADGAFTFPAENDGTAYAVTVSSQPVMQTCVVTNGSGTLAGADVNNVLISCVTDMPTVVLSTTSLNYTPVEIGQSQNSIITVSNTGTADLVISGFNPPALPFSMVGGSCLNTPVTLVPNASCQIEVSFAPTSLGSFNDAIGILSNAPSSPDVVQLVATGIAAPPAKPVPSFNLWGLLILITLFGITAQVYRKPS